MTLTPQDSTTLFRAIYMELLAMRQYRPGSMRYWRHRHAAGFLRGLLVAEGLRETQVAGRDGTKSWSAVASWN